MRTTSSSISSSDRPPPASAWRRFAATLLGAAALAFAATGAAVVAIDPYDTGRLSLLRTPGLPDQTPRTASASRVRDPAFDAAIVGNSHTQILSPENLSAGTGRRFLQLSVPGTGPREQLLLLDAFRRHRPADEPRALVFGIDPYWCRPEPDMPTWLPFPFWLYDPSLPAYLGGLVRTQSVEDAVKRLAWALGLPGRPTARRDGYIDYDEGRVWRADREGTLLRTRVLATVPNASGRFPAMDALARTLDGLPRDTAVVLLQPPIFHLALPEPDGIFAAPERACRAALVRVAAGRDRVALLDWRTDRPEVHELENFIDPTHYRGALARAVEVDIVAAFKRLGEARPRH